MRPHLILLAWVSHELCLEAVVVGPDCDRRLDECRRRDTKFCDSFRGFLSDEGVKPVRLPPRSPNLNAHLERIFQSLKSECLDRLILFSEKAMCNSVLEYLAHYHTERNHQGLAQSDRVENVQLGN